MMAEYEQTIDVLPLTGYGVDDDGDGIVTISVAIVTPGTAYLIERITVSTSDGFGTIAAPKDIPFELFAQGGLAPGPGAASPTTLREFTPAGGEASADEANPLRFWSGETITARFSGLTAGGNAAVYLQARVVAPVVPPVSEAPAEGQLTSTEGQTPAEVGWN